MAYLIQVTIYTTILYAVYLLLLRNRAVHGFNRAYLLLCAVLPFAIPFIKIPALSGLNANVSIPYILLPEITIATDNPGAAYILNNRETLFIAAYGVIALLLLLRTIYQYTLLRHLIRRHEYTTAGNVRVVLNTNAGPGSFGNYAFFPTDAIDPVIFEHELAHIRLKHSVDILLLRLLQAICWPNLMLYVIMREMKLVHEFQADASTAANKEAYIHTLLNNTFSTNRFTLVHTFFYHPLKRRIMMLHNSPLSGTSIRLLMLKTVCMASMLFTGIIYLQSCKPATKDVIKNHEQTSPAQMKAWVEKGPQPNQIVPSEPDRTADGQLIYKMADKMPVPSVVLSTYLSEQLTYPGNARKQQIEGRVLVRFIVDENGNVMNPEIVQSDRSGVAGKSTYTSGEPKAAAAASKALEAEALRVVSQIPKWIPGEKDGKKVAVYFHLPIVFKL